MASGPNAVSCAVLQLRLWVPRLVATICRKASMLHSEGCGSPSCLRQSHTSCASSLRERSRAPAAQLGHAWQGPPVKAWCTCNCVRWLRCELSPHRCNGPPIRSVGCSYMETAWAAPCIRHAGNSSPPTKAPPSELKAAHVSRQLPYRTSTNDWEVWPGYIPNLRGKAWAAAVIATPPVFEVDGWGLPHKQHARMVVCT